MKIVVSAQGETLDAPTSPIFGRCPVYIFVGTETMEFTAVHNMAASQGSGAGIQAAQFMVDEGTEAVITGNVGPNAFGVLNAADIPCYLAPEGTVRQAVEAFKAGRLQQMSGASVSAHSGLGMGDGTGRGMGGGMGRGGARRGRSGR